MKGDAAKVEKAAVNYSAGGKDRCGICTHYTAIDSATGSCELVKGMIKPGMWCNLFAKAAN